MEPLRWGMTNDQTHLVPRLLPRNTLYGGSRLPFTDWRQSLLAVRSRAGALERVMNAN